MAHSFAAASKPVLATVVNHASRPSAVRTRPRSACDDVTGPQHVDGGGEVVARDVELAGEVVARPDGHDAEHAVVVGGDAGERAQRAVAPARDHGAAAGEGVARASATRSVGVGRQHDLEVEVGGGERVGDAWEPGPRRDRGPAAGFTIAVQRSGAGTHRRERSGAIGRARAKG